MAIYIYYIDKLDHKLFIFDSDGEVVDWDTEQLPPTENGKRFDENPSLHLLYLDFISFEDTQIIRTFSPMASPENNDNFTANRSPRKLIPSPSSMPAIYADNHSCQMTAKVVSFFNFIMD